MKKKAISLMILGTVMASPIAGLATTTTMTQSYDGATQTISSTGATQTDGNNTQSAAPKQTDNNQTSQNTQQTSSNTTNTSTGYKPGEVIVSLGANLTPAQKQQMLSNFNVTEGQEGVKFVEVTNQDINIEMGYPADTPIPATSQSISSCKVTLLPKGSGISVSTNNLTQVTGDMLASALTTCGINDASIVADAPYPVTGQAALAGILEGFQAATGKQIPTQNKKVANDEVKVTTNLGNQIGQQKAESIINESKSLVIKDNPNSTIQIQNIVNNVTNNYGVKLTPEQNQEVVNLMAQIQGLHLDYNNISNTLNQIQSSISKGAKDFSNVSQSVKDEYEKLKSTGFFTKVENWFSKIWHDIVTFFEGGTSAVENESSSSQNSTQQSNSTDQSQNNAQQNSSADQNQNQAQTQGQSQN